jgi:hypothetical protein
MCDKCNRNATVQITIEGDEPGEFKEINLCYEHAGELGEIDITTMTKCDRCQGVATTHVTEVTQGTGESTEMHLCDEHAEELT